MGYSCFHCEHDTMQIHMITLYDQDQERNEPLCDDCYAEWLHSIKG